MEDTIVSYETAVLAKEKGFDIYTQKVFVETLEHTLEMGRGGDCTFPYKAPRVLDSGKFDKWDIVHCKAPTQSLLQKWLREKHFVVVSICPTFNNGDMQFYYSEVGNDEGEYCSKDFKTYEDALEQGLKESLKLI